MDYLLLFTSARHFFLRLLFCSLFSFRAKSLLPHLHDVFFSGLISLGITLGSGFAALFLLVFGH